jgi:hypothetical protein
MNPNTNLNVPVLPLSQIYDPPLLAPTPTLPAPAPIQAPVPIPALAAPIVQPAPVRPAITIVSTPASPTSTTSTPTAATQSGLRSKPGSPGLAGISKILRRPTPSKSLPYDSETSPSQTPTIADGTHQHQRLSSGGGAVTPGVEKRKKFRRSWSSQTQTQTQTVQQPSQNRNRKKKVDYNFSTENDIQGIVMLEILGATDLPKIKNSAYPPHSIPISYAPKI